MRNLDAVAYVTANYPHLQGLRIVPVGALFLLAAVWQAGWLGWPPAADAGAGRWLLIGFAPALAGAAVAGRYYRTRYGVTWARPSNRGSPLLLLVALALGALVWRQLVLEWPVPVPVVFAGTVLVWLGSTHGGLRRHYIVIGCAWLLFPALGPFGIPGETRRLLFYALIGISVIGAGLGDHLILRRILVPPKPPRAPESLESPESFESPETPERPGVYDRAV